MTSGPPVPPESYVTNEAHLRDELLRIEGVVRAQLLRFKQTCPEAQRERFWHITDIDIDDMARDAAPSAFEAFLPEPDVRAVWTWIDWKREAIDKRIDVTRHTELRLVELRREFDLSPTEVDVMLLALLPLLHSRYRRLCGVLQLDAARTLPSAGFVVEALSRTASEFAGRFRLVCRTSRLVEQRLIVLGGNEDDPVALRTVTLDDRVTAFIVGGDRPDSRLSQIGRWSRHTSDLSDLPLAPEIATRLEMLPNLRAAEPDYLPRLRLQFSGPDPTLAARTFAAVAEGLDHRLFVVDVRAALHGAVPWPLIVDCALREARLDGGALLFSDGEELLNEEHPERLEYLSARLTSFPHPAAVDLATAVGPDGLVGDGTWIPFHLAAPTIEMREKLWITLLQRGNHRLEDPGAIARELAAAFQLTDGQIRDAHRGARTLARRRNVFIAAIERDDLFAACRSQVSKRLVAFAQRIEPRRDLTLKDLVLPEPNKRQVDELHTRIRNHGRIHRAMGLRHPMRQGRGVLALFVGGSGTGKTMAAEALASQQRVDLYRVDLAAVVSKWVGETEKNLSRIFADAERANCMLFFDEADAIFGRRGEVKEARDRWANLEVNYLLQRIEEFTGVVILATNLRQNIDEAFQRRIQVIVDFPMPDAKSRRDIWTRLLPDKAHREVSEPDLDELAARFELSGGNISNVVLDACYRALEPKPRKLTTRDLTASIAREYQKIIRPITQGEFGQRLYQWAMDDVLAPKVTDDVLTPESVSAGV
jgi:AAA+ superfamily predicted ATPase